MDEEAAADGDPSDGPTYFEITTAMALVHFVEHQVDAAVLEVGLGGRLDSTNVCLPVVSVITSISFDHMRQLGNTLASIAREKAGIIKPGVPVVCGVARRWNRRQLSPNRPRPRLPTDSNRPRLPIRISNNTGSRRSRLSLYGARSRKSSKLPDSRNAGPPSGSKRGCRARDYC